MRGSGGTLSALKQSCFGDLLNPLVVAVKTELTALVKTVKHLDSAVPSGLWPSAELWRRDKPLIPPPKIPFDEAKAQGLASC